MSKRHDWLVLDMRLLHRPRSLVAYYRWDWISQRMELMP